MGDLSNRAHAQVWSQLVVAFGALVAFFTFVRGLLVGTWRPMVPSGQPRGNAALDCRRRPGVLCPLGLPAGLCIWWQQGLLLARVIIGVGTIALPRWTWGVAALHAAPSRSGPASRVVDLEGGPAVPWQQPESLEAVLSGCSEDERRWR